jgi:hypothetical protein
MRECNVRAATSHIQSSEHKIGIGNRRLLAPMSVAGSGHLHRDGLRDSGANQNPDRGPPEVMWNFRGTPAATQAVFQERLNSLIGFPRR